MFFCFCFFFVLFEILTCRSMGLLTLSSSLDVCAEWRLADGELCKMVGSWESSRRPAGDTPPAFRAASFKVAPAAAAAMSRPPMSASSASSLLLKPNSAPYTEWTKFLNS